jgi:hypothetical protein
MFGNPVTPPETKHHGTRKQGIDEIEERRKRKEEERKRKEEEKRKKQEEEDEGRSGWGIFGKFVDKVTDKVADFIDPSEDEKK